MFLSHETSTLPLVAAHQALIVFGFTISFGTITSAVGYETVPRRNSIGTITTYADFNARAPGGNSVSSTGTTWVNFNSATLTHPGFTNNIGFQCGAKSGGTNNYCFLINSNTASSGAGVCFGTAGDTCIWRGAANQLTLNSGTALVVPTDITARHHLCSGVAPTIACGTGAQGAGTGTCTVTGTDCGGTITVVTAGVPAAGATIVTVTFNAAFPSALNAVVISPFNGNTRLLSGTTGIGIGSQSTTTFTLTSGTVGLTTGTTYIWTFMARGS